MNKTPLLLRVIAISQLISAFSVFLWILFDPFMGEHYRLKEELLLIQNIRGDEALMAKVPLSEAEKLKRNQSRFSQLSPSARVSIDDKAHLLEWKMSASTLSKLGRGFKRAFFETPFILLLWIVLSTLFAIGCLKENDLLTRYCWITPLLLFAYGYGIWLTATPLVSPYPSESEIISNHLKRPLGLTLEEQAIDLKKGWEIYLIEKWAKDLPNEKQYSLQVEQGEFAFNLYLLDLKKNEQKENGSLLLLFLGLSQGLALYILSRQRSRLMRTMPVP